MVDDDDYDGDYDGDGYYDHSMTVRGRPVRYLLVPSQRNKIILLAGHLPATNQHWRVPLTVRVKIITNDNNLILETGQVITKDVL